MRCATGVLHAARGPQFTAAVCRALTTVTTPTTASATAASGAWHVRPEQVHVVQAGVRYFGAAMETRRVDRRQTDKEARKARTARIVQVPPASPVAAASSAAALAVSQQQPTVTMSNEAHAGPNLVVFGLCFILAMALTLSAPRFCAPHKEQVRSTHQARSASLARTPHASGAYRAPETEAALDDGINVNGYHQTPAEYVA